MKLRTTHNSIRIRIRKSELVTLQNEQRVEESIQFPNGVCLKFALVTKPNIPTTHAHLENNELILSIPTEEAQKWMNTNQVGIETHSDLGGGEQLHLLIEKDFPCLDRPEEDKSDTFWELAPDTPDAC